MELTLDKETRSSINLKQCGLYVYAEGEDTDVMCISVKEDAKRSRIYVPKIFRRLGPTMIEDDELIHLVETADRINAHNSGFERTLWTHIMVGKYGLDEIDFNKWRCTAAKAASYALPRALKYACEALGLAEQKDTTGYRVMMKMCKPNSKGVWQENPKDFAILCKYCMQDTEAEYELDKTLPDLPPKELEIWQLDQRINDRGVTVDIAAIDNLIFKVAARKNQLLLEIQELTGGRLKSTKQRDATLAWLKDEGLELPDLQKATVLKALKDDKIPSDARHLLTLSQSISMSSVTKLDAMKRRACKDHRIRGAFLYYGTHTGRWAGQGIQPQNYKRDSFESNDIREVLNLTMEEIEVIYGCTLEQASKCTRGMIIPGKGMRMKAADYTAIEGRFLAWIACETEILQAYEDGKDPYKVAAMSVFHKKYEEINDKERFVGKQLELACGYQGWVAAFRRIGGDEVRDMSDEKIAGFMGAWRESRGNTVRFWRGVNAAALKAIKTHKVQTYGMVKFGIRDRFLHCRLPSGRFLSYCDPAYEMMTDKYNREREIITYMGVNPKNKKWTRLSTYGGKLTENIVQALSRDVLADAMLKFDMLGYDIIMHVHDEIVLEDASNDGVEDMEELMSITPAWAFGCPISAKGWVSDRFRKD